MTKYILSILILMVISCATINEEKRLKLLEAVTDRYENAIRWGHYELASRIIKKSD